VTLSAMPVVLIAWMDRSGRGGWGQLAALAAGVAVACVVIGLFMGRKGSSLAGIFACVWTMPQRLGFGVSFDTAPSLGNWTTVLVAVPLGLGLIAALARWQLRAAVGLLLVLKAGFAILVLWPRIPFSAFFFLDHATPWLWLALLPIEDGRLAPVSFSRLLAVTSAHLLTLWAYSVPGTQTGLATFLFVLPAAISGGDVLAAARGFSPRFVGRALPRAIALLIVLVFVGNQTRRLVGYATESYDASVPVRLPGITRLRLDPDVVTVLTALVRELRDAPDTSSAPMGATACTSGPARSRRPGCCSATTSISSAHSNRKRSCERSCRGPRPVSCSRRAFLSFRSPSIRTCFASSERRRGSVRS
jgi:hypothetical protein